MKYFRKVSLISLIIVSLPSFAGEWKNEGTIDGFYIDLRDAKQFILFRHSEPRSGDTCTNNGDYYELKMDASKSKEAYAFLLSLEARKEKVKIYLDGCGATGFPMATIVNTVGVSK